MMNIKESIALNYNSFKNDINFSNFNKQLNMYQKIEMVDGSH